jgi:hypothetical protein
MDHHDHDTSDDVTDAVPTDRRPLGYWLRTIDHLISREFASALADEGVTRRDWMLLNAVSGDVDLPGRAERLARRGKRLAGLEKRGWVDQAGDGTWSLTDEGRAAKERIGAIVDGIRTRITGAVSPEDFATTMASLEAIAHELGWSEDFTGHRGHSGFGRGFDRGFGPRGRGFGFGFARPGFGPEFGRGFHAGFGPRSEHGCVHGYHDEWHGEGHGHHGLGERHSEHHGYGESRRHHGHGESHGHHGHGESHGHHGERHGDDARHRRHEGDHHDAEQAYERGFDAGYARGAVERD